jgi:hypothetical protein
VAIANFIPELWSTQLQVAFRKNLVFGNLVNRQYEGEISDVGNTVKIQTPAAITVGSYAGTVTYQAPTSTTQSLLIDQDKYWAFEIDDAEALQSNVNLMQAYMQEASYALANTVDADLAGLYTAAGLANIDLTLSSGDMYDTMVLAGQQLDVANVPRSGRWVVMSPQGYALLLKTAEFIHATPAGDSVARTGEVGQVAGFTVYVSNNVVLATTRKYLYGTNAAIAYAAQVVKTEAVRRDAAFKDAIRGRLVYGRKVIRPSALGVIVATE